MSILEIVKRNDLYLQLLEKKQQLEEQIAALSTPEIERMKEIVKQLTEQQTATQLDLVFEEDNAKSSEKFLEEAKIKYEENLKQRDELLLEVRKMKEDKINKIYEDVRSLDSTLLEQKKLQAEKNKVTELRQELKTIEGILEGKKFYLKELQEQEEYFNKILENLVNN